MTAETSRPYQQKYATPPIVEAVIEIRFQPGVPAEAIKKVEKKVIKQYPQVTQQEVTTVSFDFVSKDTSSSSLAHGSQWRKEDESVVVTFLTDRFSLAHRAPYPGWEVYFGEFKSVWAKLRATAKPQLLTRIGMRYINRIDVPIQPFIGVKFEDYLNYFPNFENPQLANIRNFFCQVQVEAPEQGCVATIGLAPGPPNILVDHTSFVLDIDVFREHEIPQADRGVFDLLSDMRSLRNVIFEGAITDTARDLFK